VPITFLLSKFGPSELWQIEFIKAHKGCAKEYKGNIRNLIFADGEINLQNETVGQVEDKKNLENVHNRNARWRIHFERSVPYSVYLT